MNKIKEVMLEAFPNISELCEKIENECVKEGCKGCPLYNISFPNFHGKTCPMLLLAPLYELTSEIVKENRKSNKNE